MYLVQVATKDRSFQVQFVTKPNKYVMHLCTVKAFKKEKQRESERRSTGIDPYLSALDF